MICPKCQCFMRKKNLTTDGHKLWLDEWHCAYCAYWKFAEDNK